MKFLDFILYVIILVIVTIFICYFIFCKKSYRNNEAFSWTLAYLVLFTLKLNFLFEITFQSYWIYYFYFKYIFLFLAFFFIYPSAILPLILGLRIFWKKGPWCIDPNLVLVQVVLFEVAQYFFPYSRCFTVGKNSKCPSCA